MLSGEKSVGKIEGFNMGALSLKDQITTRDNLVDGPGIRNLRVFLAEMIAGFARRSLVYCDAVGELPICYGEKQTTSVLLPAFSDAATAILMEQAVARPRNGTTGFIDFWIMQKNFTLLVELKHAWGHVDGKFHSALSKVWEKAIEQSTDIGQEDLYNLHLTQNLFSLALVIVPEWVTANDSDINFSDKECKEYIEKNIEDILLKKPNWWGSWCLEDQYKGPYEYANGKKQMHPAIHFLGYLQRWKKEKDNTYKIVK